MKISLVAENVAGDEVTLLSPKAVREVIDATGLEFLIEEGAGVASGFGDKEYTRLGSQVAEKSVAYDADIIVRRSAPSHKDIGLMHKGALVISMLHPDGCPEKIQWYKDAGIAGIALDMLMDARGKRLVYLADLTARNAVDYGYKLLGKDPKDVSVTVLGYGNLAKEAIEHVSRLQSDVKVLNKKHFPNIKDHIGDADMLVNAINWPFHLRGKEFVMTRNDLKYMKEGAILVDLVVNPRGKSPIETCMPTYQDAMHYEVDGITHTCCWGWPGLTPKKTCQAYSAILPEIIADFASRGLDGRPEHITRAYVNPSALPPELYSVRAK